MGVAGGGVFLVGVEASKIFNSYLALGTTYKPIRILI